MTCLRYFGKAGQLRGQCQKEGCFLRFSLLKGLILSVTMLDSRLKVVFHSIKYIFFLNTYILNLCESIKNFLVPIINPLMLFFVKKLVLLNFPIPIPLEILVVRSDALRQFF